jgi:hypothetical protein
MMHQIVLLTALSMTGGLFGGGRHCQTGHCGRPAWGHHRVVAQPCAYPAGAPCVAGAPQAQPIAQAAPQAPLQAAANYHSYYNNPAAYYPAVSGCASGNCPRR